MDTTSAAAAALSPCQAPMQTPRLRIALRGWGFSTKEVASLLPDLPDLRNALHWEAEERPAGRPDLVIHVIDAARLGGVSGGARWNAIGPADAMYKAFRRGASEVALVVGSREQLPARRHGCWILSGTRSLAAALGIIAGTTIEPLLSPAGGRAWGIHDLAATHSLCTLSREMAREHEALARDIAGAVNAALDLGGTTPSSVLVAAASDVLDHALSVKLPMSERVLLFRRRDQSVGASDLSAEILVAYRWASPVAQPPRD